jgi:thymidylate synthase ThyX
MISAKIVADSINESGNRITSLVVVIPRIVLAELNTHRALSKNSASSRAIPFKKMLNLVQEEPFIPLAFQKDHKGMQGTEYFTEIADKNNCINMWLDARDKAVASAKELNEFGVTKQLCNRILEPFMYHTVLITGTEWENFMALRNHNDAEIHIKEAAVKILEALNGSTPRLLKKDEWHIPFGDDLDYERVSKMYSKSNIVPEKLIYGLMVEIATARCARVSYLNFEGKDDYEADVKLHDQLLDSGHMSPFEHCAQAQDGDTISGNFVGWRQYRKLYGEENRKDSRIIKH